jgi:hypothetical protein
LCETIHKHFGRITEILKADVVMMMEAYFDESGTHTQSPVVCVAGYLFTTEQAWHLDREWTSTLSKFGVSHFHATECGNGYGEFSQLTAEQRTEFTRQIIGIIKRRMTVGIAVSVSDNDFGQVHSPQWLKGGPYVLCAAVALLGVTAWADRRSYSGEISYHFEAGDKFQSTVNQVITEMSSSAVGRSGLRYHSHTFSGKRDRQPLQAADLIAYEWHRELKRLNGPPTKRSMRQSLESLLEQPHYTQHLGAEQIDQFGREGYASLAQHLDRFNLVE